MKQYYLTVDIATSTKKTLWLGRVGENLAREIVFDCSKFAELYGPGTALLFVKQPNDGVKYPVAIAQNGNIVHWVITAADVGVSGYGQAELQWIVDNSVSKTQIFTTKIYQSMTGTDAPEPPDPYQDWVDEITEVGAQASIDAASASRSADNAAASQEAAHTSEVNAAASAQNAAQSAESSSDSALSASVSKESASSSAASAASSAASAASSSASASESATLAGNSAEAASVSARNAALSEGGAADSAASAASSAATAQTASSNANTSAGNASLSASAAAGSAASAAEDRTVAVSAKEAAISAKDTAVSASGTATSAKDDAVTAKNTAVSASETAVSAKDDAVIARNTAVSAKNEILTVEQKLDTLSEFYMAENILDNSNEAIQDSSNGNILGRVTFAQAGDILSLQNQIAGIHGIFEQERVTENQRLALLEDKLQIQITQLESVVNTLIQHALLDSSYNT